MTPVRPEPSGRALRLVWCLCLVLIACLAIPVQLDRQARRNPAFAGWVPAPFRGFAGDVLVREEIAAGAPEVALRDARQLLERRPVPASHLSYLATAEVRAGHLDVASQAIYLAAQREWRDAFAQQAIAEVALANGEPEIAAQRLYALWTVTGGEADNDPQLAKLTNAVLAQPSAQVEFGKQLAGAARWRDSFFEFGVKSLPDDVFVNTLASAQDGQVAFNCKSLGRYSRELMLDGQVALAERAWKGGCGAGQAKGAGDFAFYQIEAPAGSGPYDWVYPDSASTSLQFVADERSAAGRTKLQFINADPVIRLVAQRYVKLVAGTHVAVLRARMTGGLSVGSSDARLFLRVDCMKPDGGSLMLVRINAGEGDAAFSVPVGCPVQRVALFVQRGEGTIETASVQ